METNPSEFDNLPPELQAAMRTDETAPEIPETFCRRGGF